MSIPLISNIAIWEKGNAGESLDSESQAIYELLIQNMWSRANALSIAIELVEGRAASGIADFAAFLYTNPGARETWLRLEAQDRATLIPPPSAMLKC